MRSTGRGRCAHRRLRRCRRHGDSSGRSRSRIRRTPRSGCTLGSQPFGGLPLRPETSCKIVISTRTDTPRLCGIRRRGGRPGRIFHSTDTGRAHSRRRWRRTQPAAISGSPLPAGSAKGWTRRHGWTSGHGRTPLPGRCGGTCLRLACGGRHRLAARTGAPGGKRRGTHHGLFRRNASCRPHTGRRGRLSRPDSTGQPLPGGRRNAAVHRRGSLAFPFPLGSGNSQLLPPVAPFS